MHTEGLAAAYEHNPRNPGKFEGAPMETVYYYMVEMDGLADEQADDPNETLFRVKADEARTFQIPQTWYLLRHHDNGFVTGRSLTDGEKEEWCRIVESA